MADALGRILFGLIDWTEVEGTNKPGAGLIARIIDLATEHNRKIDSSQKEIINEIRKNGSGKPDQVALDKMADSIITRLRTEINKCSCTEKLKNELKPQLEKLQRDIETIPSRIPRPSGDGGSSQGSSWGLLALPPPRSASN